MKNLIIVASIFFASCSNAKEDPVISEFSRVIELKGTTTPIESKNLGEVVDIQIMGSLLILNEMFSDKIYKVFDINTGRLIEKCITKGKGPNEVLYPSRIHICDDHIFAQYDKGKKQLLFFLLAEGQDSIIQFKHKSNVGTEKLETYPINESDIICTGIFQEGRYCLYNIISGRGTISGEYPEQKELSKLNRANKSIIYQPTITLKPDKKKFASFEGMAGYWEIMEINSTAVIKAYSKNYYPPKIDIVAGQTGFKKDNLYAFHSACCTNNFIYVVYSGRSMNEFGSEYYAGDNLLVYDWNGNPIVNYKLDHSLKIMTFDQKRMQVYGLVTNPVTGEPEIVKYQLPNESSK